jgi:hypothetical protein
MDNMGISTYGRQYGVRGERTSRERARGEREGGREGGRREKEGGRVLVRRRRGEARERERELWWW